MCYVMLCCIMLLYTEPLRHMIPYDNMLCCITLHYVTLYYVVIIMLCCVALHYITLSMVCYQNVLNWKQEYIFSKQVHSDSDVKIGSISNSRLYPAQTTDLHVRIATNFFGEYIPLFAIKDILIANHRYVMLRNAPTT